MEKTILAFINSVEFDARIHPNVTQVRHQPRHQADEGKQIQRAQHHRVVAADHAFIAQQPQAVERKQRFNQQRPREKRADERRRKARDDGNERIAQHVSIEHLPLAQPFGARREHVLIEERGSNRG